MRKITSDFWKISLAVLSTIIVSCSCPKPNYEYDVMNMCLVTKDPRTAIRIFGPPTEGFVPMRGYGGMTWHMQQESRFTTQDPTKINVLTTVSETPFSYNITTTAYASGGRIREHNISSGHVLWIKTHNGKNYNYVYLRHGYDSISIIEKNQYLPIAELLETCRTGSISCLDKILNKNKNSITFEDITRGCIEASKKDNIKIVEHLIKKYSLDTNKKIPSWINSDYEIKSHSPYGTSAYFKSESANLSIRDAAILAKSQKTLKFLSTHYFTP